MINYSRINFENFPNITTPINATRLNKMDKAIYDLDIGIGLATDASSVTGTSIFQKIGTLYTSLASVTTATTNKVKYNGTAVSSINFSVNNSTLTITTS